MKIKNVNGTFWNEDNDCFGPIQASTEYTDYADMPDFIYTNDGTELERTRFEWYPEGDDSDAVASVVS